MADSKYTTKDDDGNEYGLLPVSDWVDWYGEESGIPLLDLDALVEKAKAEKKPEPA